MIIEHLSHKIFWKWMKEQLKGVEKMVQFGLSENIIFWGFKCLFSSLNIRRNIENQERSSYLSLDNEKIRLKIVGDCWQITFVTLNKFSLLNTLLLFLMDSIKLDGVPSKIKWKIHGCFTLCHKFWRYFL